MEVSHAEFVEAMARTFGATLYPTTPHPDVPAGQKALCEKISPNGHRFIFTASGFTFPGHGFIPYHDVVRATWGEQRFDQPKDKDHQNYLVVHFRDSLPVQIYLGGSSSSVSFGGLIKMMQLLEIEPDQPS